MKPLKKHFDYLPIIYFPIFSLALIIVIFFPQQAVLCFRVHWLILLFTIILMVSPLGKIRLGEAPALKFHVWLGLMMSASIGVTLIYWGLVYVCFFSLPVLIPADQTLISNTGKTLLFTWGAFPWALFILLGVGLAYVSYCQKRIGKFSFALQALMKNSDEDATSLSTDFIVRTIAHFSLAYSIGIITLLSTQLLAKIFDVQISVGLRYATLLVSTILLIGINTTQWQKTIRYFAIRRIPLSLITILFIVIAAVIIVIANIAIMMFINNFTQGNVVLTAFTIPHWQTNWQVLSGMWWIAWTPLIAGLIAFLSKGYRIRTVIFGGLLILIINVLLIAGLTQTSILESTRWNFLNYLLPWIGFVIIISLFMQKKYLVYQMRAVVPGTQIQKRRSLLFYTQTLFQSATFIAIIYLPSGIYIVNIYTFVMIFPLAILATTTCLSIAKVLYRESSQKK